MQLLLNRWTKQLQTLYVHRSYDVEGTRQHFVWWHWPKGKGQIMYFLVNATPPKPLDVATSNIAGV